MKVIGLTGGIGTGKSTVSKYLKNKENFKIIDADFLAREELRKGSSTLYELKKEFGENIFLANGELDRKKLADIVFKDDNKLNKLENIVTQKVCDKISQIVNHAKNDDTKYLYLIIDAPLLFEKKLNELCDTTWLITCDTSERIKRIQERDQLSCEEIENRMNMQLSDEAKKQLADHIINNSGSLDNLFSQIDYLIEELK